MTELGVHVRVVGGLLLGLTLLHFGFARRFAWAEELPRLSLLNRRLMEVHTLFIAVTVGMMGLLCLAAAPTLLAPTPLGRWTAAGFTAFWALRVYCQFFVYDAALWRGKLFETTVHIVFAVMFSYVTAVFGCVTWRQWHS